MPQSPYNDDPRPPTVRGWVIGWLLFIAAGAGLLWYFFK